MFETTNQTIKENRAQKKQKNYTSDIQNHAQEKDFNPHPCGFPLLFSVAPSSESSELVDFGKCF